MTEKLLQAGNAIGIPVLEHIVMGKFAPERPKADYFSMLESGHIPARWTPDGEPYIHF